MDLKSILQRVDDIESNAPTFKHYLNESVYSSPEMEKHWKRLDEGFFKPYYQYLQEAALTPDQIQNIFKQAGSAGGGAPADTAKEAEKLVDKVLPDTHAANLAKSLPDANAGPVQGFDQKAQAAIDSIPNADSSTKQSLMQMVKAGLQKPEAQQLILSALGGGIGGIVGKLGWAAGPVGAAATGALVAGVVSIAAAKMQGKDWKSAFKGAIKPALMGGAGAVVGNLATQAVGAGIDALSHKGDAPASLDNPKAFSGQGASSGVDGDAAKASQLAGGGMTNPDGSPMTNAQVSAAMDRVAPVAGSAADPNKYYNSLSPEQQRAADNAVVAQAKAADNMPPPAPGHIRYTATNNADPADPAVMAQIRARQEYLRQNPAELQRMFGDGTRNFEESLYNKQSTLKEWLRRDAEGIAIASVQLYPYVVESIIKFLKEAEAPAAGAAPAKGATADSLNQAWTAAGSPTDSEEVAKILQQAGVAPDAITKIYTDLKIPAPGAPAPAGQTPADPAQQAAGAPGTETPAGATAPATPGAEPPATQQADKQSKIGVGQINKIVPTLRVRDLKSVQKNVDNTLAKRSQPKQPTAESKYVGFYSKFLNKEI